MVEIRHRYQQTFMAEPAGLDFLKISRDIIGYSLNDAKRNLEGTEEIYHFLPPENEKEAKYNEFTLKMLNNWKERAEKAKKYFADKDKIDFVMFSDGGYLLNMLADKDNFKLRLYLRPDANLSEHPFLFDEHIEGTEEMVLSLNKKREDNIDYFWFDVDGACDDYTQDELLATFGEGNFR